MAVQKVTTKFLDKLDKQLGSKKVIYVDTVLGQASVTVDEYFGELKIKKLIDDIVLLLTPLLEGDEIKPEDLVSPVSLVPVLILREFTDLPISKENDLSALTNISEQLMNHGLVEQIFDQMNQTEIEKVSELVSKANKNLPAMKKMIQEMYAKFAIQELAKEEADVDATVQESK